MGADRHGMDSRRARSAGLSQSCGTPACGALCAPSGWRYAPQPPTEVAGARASARSARSYRRWSFDLVQIRTLENHRKGVWRARVPLTVGSLCRSDGTAAYGRSPPRESLGSSTAATALEASPANLCANNLYEWPRRARSIGRKGELAAERARDAEALAKLAAKPNVTMPSQWRDRLPTARRRLIER